MQIIRLHMLRYICICIVSTYLICLQLNDLSALCFCRFCICFFFCFVFLILKFRITACHLLTLACQLVKQLTFEKSSSSRIFVKRPHHFVHVCSPASLQTAGSCICSCILGPSSPRTCMSVHKQLRIVV